MARLSKAEKRKAIVANCGGCQDVPDSAIAQMWDDLTDETRKIYLENARDKKDGSKAHD